MTGRVFFASYLEFYIGLSLDGPGGQNDKARIDKKANGTFSKILHAMEILRKHEVPFGILATITRIYFARSSFRIFSNVKAVLPDLFQIILCQLS
jgi:sulfatase maturation enzyme AslB (radical SAM superfamily)